MLKLKQWWRRRQRAKALAAEAKAEADGADSGDGKKPSVGPPGLLDRLKEQVKKQATKLKEKLLAGKKLLKNLTKLDPGALAKALGPALMAAGAVAGVGAAVALPLYAVANEREDDRQLETADIAEMEELQERLDEAEQALATVPGFEDIPEIPDTTTPGATTTLPDLAPSVAALADRLGDLEGLDVVESPALADIQDRIDDLSIPTPTTPPVTVDLAPLEDQASSAIAAADEAATAAAQAASNAEAARQAAEANAAGVAALEGTVEDLDTLTALSAALDDAQTETAAVVAELEETVADTTTAATEAQQVADQALAEAVLAAEGVDTAQMTAEEAQEAADEALATAEAVEEFDPTALEAADAANLAAAEAAATAAAAAQTAAEDALAEAETAAEEIEQVGADLDDIESVFFAQLIEDYSQGVPINMTAHSCTSGANTTMLNAGDGRIVFNGVSTPPAGGTGCREFRPVIPNLPSACSFPASGSAQVRLIGASSVSVTASGAGVGRLESSQGTIGSASSSAFVFRAGVTEAEINEWDTFRFWRYDGSTPPYFQLYVEAVVTSQQFFATGLWTDATFQASISCT